MIEISVWLIPLIGAIGALVPLLIWRKGDRADRRRQAVPALAAARDLVDKLPPDQWAINANPKSLERWETIRDEWLAMRPGVIAVRSLYPTHELAVESVCSTVDNLMVEVGWLVRSVLDHTDFQEWRDRAVDSQSTARTGINSLLNVAGRS